MKNFDHVTAPFDGTVTARNTDIGQLIAADSGPEFFAWRRPIRCAFMFACRSRSFTPSRPDKRLELTFQELPGRIFEAKVTRTAGAVDPASRTLQVELQVPNPRGEIFAGSYAQVRFNEAADPNALTISDNALIFRAQGMQVARRRRRQQGAIAIRHARTRFWQYG